MIGEKGAQYFLDHFIQTRSLRKIKLEFYEYQNK